MIRSPALLLAGIILHGVAARPAVAQEDPRLSAIEAQIRALQSELARVRRDLAARDGDVRAARQEAARARATQERLAAQPAPPAPPPVLTAAAPLASAAPARPNPGGVSFPSGKPTFTSDDGRFQATVGLQFNYDVGGYFQGDRTPETRGVPRLNTFGQNLRRGRIPFTFRYDDFQVNITPDFGGSPDGSPSLYEANINWTPVPKLTATLGYFKPWLTLQDSSSSNDFLFLERPSVVEISRNIAAGDARSAVGVRWADPRYFLASYLTGGNYGSQNTAGATPQQTGVTVRAAGRPVASDDWDLHLGFSGSDAFRLQRSSAGQTINLQDRPELRIDNNRLVGTGGLTASSAYSYGPEFALRWRNLLLQGEYIEIGVERAGQPASTRAPSLGFSGGYAEASWVITGEPRRYSANSATFQNPRPARPFSLKDGGYGAFELVGRYSHVDLNDKVTRGIAAATTGGVFGGSQDVYAVGLNWYPNEQLRMMLNYDIINVDRLSASGTTQIGQRIQAVALRAQAAF